MQNAAGWGGEADNVEVGEEGELGEYWSREAIVGDIKNGNVE